MREPVDGLRSLKRYVALALGPQFEVRLSSEKGTFHRPYARVSMVPSLSMVTESWSVTKLIATYAVSVFPARKDSADESQAEALRVTDLLWAAFSGPGTGTPTLRPYSDSTRGFPLRVPLYDYAGVPLRGPNAFADEDDRDPRDFMKLEAPADVQLVANDDDELLWSVAANIRMSWLRSAAVPSTASTAASVNLEANEANG